MAENPKKKRKGKGKSKDNKKTLNEKFINALQGHTAALKMHTFALTTTTAQNCVLKQTAKEPKDLDTPLSKLFPMGQAQPLDLVYEACNGICFNCGLDAYYKRVERTRRSRGAAEATLRIVADSFGGDK